MTIQAPSQLSQKALISTFFGRAGSRFDVSGDLTPKTDAQVEIGKGRSSGLINDVIVIEVSGGEDGIFVLLSRVRDWEELLASALA